MNTLPKSTVAESSDAHRERIKVKLDHRTIVVVHSMQDFKTWKSRYPDARIIK